MIAQATSDSARANTITPSSPAGTAAGMNGTSISQLSASPASTATAHAIGGRIMTFAVSVVSAMAGTIESCKSGLAWTQLRPTGFMQEYLRETPSIIQDGAFYLALGDTKLNPIDVVDVAKVGFLLLRDGGHQGARLHMTGPEALTMTEMADRISRAVGKTVRYVAVSPMQRRQALIANGVPPQIADALDRQVEERLKGGIESQVDLSTHQLFNVKPTTFLAFARRNAEAFGAAAATA